MSLLKVRPRRLRENPLIRSLVAEHTVLSKELIQPLFVKEGLRAPAAIASMPGQFQHSLESLVREGRSLEAAGVPAVILFGIPANKDLSGKAAYSPKGIIQKAVRALKKGCPGLLVITDVCLCEYLSHGHCGHADGGRVKNDASVKTLAKTALSHADAGADIVAPSDMMDGRVAAMRETLDDAGHEHMPILSYSVKYASAFYSPFRAAAESAPGFGDRGGYQMDAANGDEAIREAEADLREGADMILVKPALAYGDIIRRLKERFSCPVGAYVVSGEYAMVKAAAQKGWLDEPKIVREIHLSLKRAGATFFMTYWAKDLALDAQNKRKRS